MKEANEYAELVAKAEQAVASVKDPELKRVAFQKVLDDLLGSGTETRRHATQEVLRVRRRPRRASSAKASSKTGPKAYIEKMVADGFFKKQKTIAQVKAELENRGHHIPLTSLSGPLQKLCQQKALRRQRTDNSDGKKQTFAYSEW